MVQGLQHVRLCAKVTVPTILFYHYTSDYAPTVLVIVHTHNARILCRYKLNFTARDSTGEGNFFCFDNAARQVVKKDCQTLFHSTLRVNGIPPALEAIIGATFTFAIGLTLESYHTDTRTYLINRVMPDGQQSAPPPLQPPPQLTLPSPTPAHTLPTVSKLTGPSLTEAIPPAQSHGTTDQEHDLARGTPPPVQLDSYVRDYHTKK